MSERTFYGRNGDPGNLAHMPDLLAQYVADAKHDNSRILFDRTTGDPCGWTDTAGKAHPLPVDFQRVSAATREQFRSYWLRYDATPDDEQTMDHVDVRGMAAVIIHQVTPSPNPAHEWTELDRARWECNPYAASLTLTKDEARQFHRDQRQRDEAADRNDEDMRDFWQQIALITLGCIVGAAGYMVVMAVIDAVLMAWGGK